MWKTRPYIVDSARLASCLMTCHLKYFSDHTSIYWWCGRDLSGLCGICVLWRTCGCGRCCRFNFQAHQGLLRTNELRALSEGNRTKNQRRQIVRGAIHHSWTERLGPWVQAGGVSATCSLHAQNDYLCVEGRDAGRSRTIGTRPHREDTLYDSDMRYK